MGAAPGQRKAGVRSLIAARPAVAVAATATSTRLLYWVLITPRWKPASDAAQYVDLARSLADGRGFGAAFPQLWHHPTAFRPPLYPVLLTPLVWANGSALWPLRLLNVALGATVAVLAFLLTRRIAGARAGLVAGLVVACYPPLIANDTVTLSEPLALVLLLATVLLIDARRWCLGALTTGLLLLTRPNGYLVVAIVAVWIWRSAGWRRALSYGAVVGIVLGPWVVRNEVQVHTMRLVTSDGFTMAALYAPSAQAAGRFIDPLYDPSRNSFEERLLRLDEAKWNEHLQRVAVDAMRAHPAYVLDVVRRNAAAYLEIRPSYNEKAEWFDGRRWQFRQTVLPLFYAVTLVGWVGVVMWRRDHRVLVLGLLALQFAVLSLLLVAPPRLRGPFDLVCCIGVGLAYTSFRDKARPGTAQRAPAARNVVPTPATGTA